MGRKRTNPRFDVGDNVLLSLGDDCAPLCVVVLRVGPQVDGDQLYQVHGPEHGHGLVWATGDQLRARPAGDETHEHKHHHVDQELLRELEEIESLQEDTLAILRAQARKPLNLSIREVHGKGSPAMQLPPLVLLDTEKVLLSVNPLNADGSPDTTSTVSWASSDPSVGLDVQADSRSAFALTPGESGSATVTASATGYESASVDISYKPGAPRELNLSAGTPVSDL